MCHLKTCWSFSSISQTKWINFICAIVDWSMWNVHSFVIFSWSCNMLCNGISTAYNRTNIYSVILYVYLNGRANKEHLLKCPAFVYLTLISAAEPYNFHQLSDSVCKWTKCDLFCSFQKRAADALHLFNWSFDHPCLLYCFPFDSFKQHK